MPSCTPTFTPLTGSPPTLEGCVMDSFTETRSRALVGGSLFRSVNVGTLTNIISIRNEWMVNDPTGSPAELRQYNDMIDILADVTHTRLSVLVSGIVVEDYTVPQSPIFSVSPVSITWNTGLTQLRIDLAAANSLVIMPSMDTGGDPTAVPLPVVDADHLSEFSVQGLTGGSGHPVGPAHSIRTGPAFALINIAESETNNADGSFSQLQEPRYWNGTCWKAFNSVSPPTACDSEPSCP